MSDLLGEIFGDELFRLIVIELPSMITRHGLTVDQTREYLREVGKR